MSSDPASSSSSHGFFRVMGDRIGEGRAGAPQRSSSSTRLQGTATRRSFLISSGTFSSKPTSQLQKEQQRHREDPSLARFDTGVLSPFDLEIQGGATAIAAESKLLGSGTGKRGEIRQDEGKEFERVQFGSRQMITDSHVSELWKSNYFQLSFEARPIDDVDEEIFLLYTLNPPPAGRLGLGQVDSKNDLVEIAFDLSTEDLPTVKPVQASSQDGKFSPHAAAGKKTSSTGKTSRKLPTSTSSTWMTVTLHQSTTSLRSAQGDTGSVIWRSSLFFAASLIRQLHRARTLPRRAEDPERPCLLKPELFFGPRSEGDGNEPLTILELGSGTAVLPCLLAAYFAAHAGSSDVRSVRWIATDQEEMLGLMDKNIARIKRLHGSSSSCFEVEARVIDWLDVSRLYRAADTSPSSLQSYISQVLSSHQDRAGTTLHRPDIIFSLDCIYNPSLLEPLRETIEAFASGSKIETSDLSPATQTEAFVLAEMREVDVLREWLEVWTRSSAGDVGQSVISIAGQQLGVGLEKGYAAWLGRSSTR